jgi:hypothetical protein
VEWGEVLSREIRAVEKTFGKEEKIKCEVQTI